MEKSDIELLQTAPIHHLQNVPKARLALIKLQLGETTSTNILPSTPEEIAQRLLDPSELTMVIRGLNELESHLLRELVSCGGRANSRDLALYFTIGNLLTLQKQDDASGTPENQRIHAGGFAGETVGVPPQYPVAHPHGPFEQALRHLLLLGLVYWGRQTNFVGRDYANGVHDGVLIVPIAVRVVIHAEWSEAFMAALKADESAEIAEGVRRLQRSLYLYWSLVASRHEGLPLVNSGLLARSSLRLVIEQLGKITGKQESRLSGEQIRVESDAPYLLFLRLLLMKLHLLQERRGAIYAVDAVPFFELPLLERARRCYLLWYETPFWNEMLYLPDVNIRPGPAALDPAHEEVLRARKTIVERLTYEDRESWHLLSTFIARTRLYAPNLLFPRQYGLRTERYMSGSNPYGWDFRLRRGWLTPREGWHLVEGGFIRSVITWPLRWLGVVETNSEENPTAFRLSSSVSFLLGNAESMDEETPLGRLIVQPNFELVALAPIPEALLVKLDRFAERMSLEHIAQYRITKASVTRAIQMGMHAEDIKAILEAAAGTDIPQNVQYSLVEWERQARRIEIWQDATLFEVDNPSLLDTLFSQEETRVLLGRRLTPQLAEVAPHQLSALQELLWQRDYLPSEVAAPSQEMVLDDDRLVVREPQWRLHDDGRLQPFHAVADLYLRAEVEQFSDLDEPTGWRRITSSAIQRARAANISLDYIVRFLRQYCEGGIPTSFLIRLKLWGGGYSGQHTIAIEHAPMLRLPSQVLEDLQNDEEISALLGSEVEQPSRLLRVHADNVERIIELLRERGFEVL